MEPTGLSWDAEKAVAKKQDIKSSRTNTPNENDISTTTSMLAMHRQAMSSLIAEARSESLKWSTRHSPLPLSPIPPPPPPNRHTPVPSSPSKRKRSQFGNPSLFPSLASAPSAVYNRQQQYEPENSVTITIQTRSDLRDDASTITNSVPSTTANFHQTAQTTAIQCIEYATKRQTAAKRALASTTTICNSLKSLLQDSTLAVSLARKSKEEAELAAERAEGSAKKVEEASKLADKDLQRAKLELAEAQAQAEEAKEFLRKVDGFANASRDKRGERKRQENSVHKRVGTAVQLSQSSSSICSSPAKTIDVSWRSSMKNGDTPVTHYPTEDGDKISSQVLEALTIEGQTLNHQSRQSLVHLWNERTKIDPLTKPLRKFKGHASPITNIVTIDSSRFLSSSWDKTIRLWDANTESCTCVFHGHGDWVHAIAVIDGIYFLSGSDDRTIKLWNTNRGDCIRTYSGHESFVKSISVTDCKKLFLSGSRDKTIKLWDIRSGECIMTFRGHSDTVSSVAALNVRRFASGSLDSTIKIWDVSSGKCVRTLSRHTGPVKDVTVVIDSSRSASKLLVSASDDKSMLLWDTESGQCLHKFGFGCMNVSVIASSFICFICDGFFLSCCGNKLQLWHIPSGKCAKIYETPSLSLAVARLDDDKFVTGSDKILSLWNLFLS
jgi:WD40 repeat protein